jgi:hypothetical protein
MTHLIWADRLAIGIFVLVVLINCWVALGEQSLHGLDILRWLLLPPLVIAFVSWIVLRTVDFMFGGQARRQIRGRR